MPDKKAISRSYKLFSSAEGNQHIASKYVIYKLQELIENFQPDKVLEVGLGIGRISGTLLALNKELNNTRTEANDFCLKSLPGDLKKDFKMLEIFTGLSEIPT